MTLETALRALSEFEAKVETLAAENRRLSLKVQDLQQQLAGKKGGAGDGPEVQMPSLFGSLAPAIDVLPPADSNGDSRKSTAARRSISGRPNAKPRGRRPLDPSLPRETIRLPDPPESERIDPVTGSALIPHHVQVVEVLARKPAVFFVKRLERRVWVSRLTGASVATPWPPDVLPRSGVDASIMAHIGAAHFAQHVPYYRIEQQLERTGVSLPRNTQVSLMARLESLVEPVVDEIRRTVLGSGYVHLDATPIDVCDRARPGKAHTAHLWAYRARSPDPTRHGLVWFDYQATKTPSEPAKVLEKAKYRGVIQTDGAAGLDRLRPPDVVTHLGCWAHARKYVAEAVESGEENARPYLGMVRRLFAVDARSREVLTRLAPEDVRRERVLTWRDRFSRPLAERLFTRAAMEVVTLPPKTALATALGYLLGQRESLMRCVITPGASLDNNPVENAIRPIKLGAKNWLFVGDPGAGPRLANLYTLIENCRQAKIDPEAYLIALIRALGTPAGFHAPEWLPGVWKARLAAGILTWPRRVSLADLHPRNTRSRRDPHLSERLPNFCRGSGEYGQPGGLSSQARGRPEPILGESAGSLECRRAVVAPETVASGTPPGPLSGPPDVRNPNLRLGGGRRGPALLAPARWQPSRRKVAAEGLDAWQIAARLGIPY